MTASSHTACGETPGDGLENVNGHGKTSIRSKRVSDGQTNSQNYDSVKHAGVQCAAPLRAVKIIRSRIGDACAAGDRQSL